MKAYPKARIYCIGVFPFYHEFGMRKKSENIVSSETHYREVIRELCHQSDGKIVYVDPQQLLSIHNLSSDLLHPSNFGHTEIAMNLYRIIEER